VSRFLPPTRSDITPAARWGNIGLPLSAQGVLDQRDGRPGVVDLNDQAGVALVGEFDHDGLRRILDVPEDLLAVEVERARRDHTGHVGARSADPLGIGGDAGVRGRAADVAQRDGQAALEGLELVETLDHDDEVVAVDVDQCHVGFPCQ
jgi:hypothetical protein